MVQNSARLFKNFGSLCIDGIGGFHTDDAASKILTRRQEWTGLYF